MPNTYTQLHIHIVFAVQNRNSLITENIRERVEKYMSGVISHKKQKLLAIYAMPDHTHLLIGIQPSIAISDLVKEIKTSTTNFINTEKLVPNKFAWQEGFGAFACSKSHTVHT
jgi:putative transposase